MLGNGHFDAPCDYEGKCKTRGNDLPTLRQGHNCCRSTSVHDEEANHYTFPQEMMDTSWQMEAVFNTFLIVDEGTRRPHYLHINVSEWAPKSVGSSHRGQSQSKCQPVRCSSDLDFVQLCLKTFTQPQLSITPSLKIWRQLKIAILQNDYVPPVEKHICWISGNVKLN